MDSWVCYLVRCVDGSLYAGITNRLPARLAAHNGGTASRYTRSRRPVLLVYSEPHPDRSSATRRELAIKGMTRAQKLKLLAEPQQAEPES